jgi:hypothetical protein
MGSLKELGTSFLSHCSFWAWVTATPSESGQASTEAKAKNNIARLATKAIKAMILSGPSSTSASSSDRETERIGALETAAVGLAEGSLAGVRGRAWVTIAPAGTEAEGFWGADTGRAKAGEVARGGGAANGIVLLPAGATGGAGRGGAPGAVGALGAGGPADGRGGGPRGAEGAGGPGRGAKGTVADGASTPGALARKVIRTVTFFRGTAEVFGVIPTEEVFLVGGGSSFSSWLMGKWV